MRLYFLFVGTLTQCYAGGCVCSSTLMTLIKGLWPGTMQCLNMADHVFMSRIKAHPPLTLLAIHSLPPLSCLYLHALFILINQLCESITHQSLFLKHLI